MQLRRRHPASGGGAATVLLAAIIVLLVLMDEWPYRTFFHNEFERIDYAGDRCYIIGDSAPELLIFCPDSAPPRNRAVRQDDPGVRRLRMIENVFKGLKATPNP
jgi:hypothetical protein